MLRKFMSFLIGVALLMGITGCTRIETGEVGMRINFDKTINTTELLPGSLNQTLWGEVITFPVKDIPVSLENIRPMTAENTALADFDLTVVYAINPTSVAELYTTKSRAFHKAVEKGGDTLLMYTYMETLVKNAAYKAVRGYKSLEVADKRAEIEEKIKAGVAEQLRAEKLDTSIHLNVVQVRNVAPDAGILAAAAAVVRAETELRAKAVEVETAKKEAERMAALSSNSEKSVAFMDAQSRLNVSQAMLNGKVDAVVIPYDFKGFVNIK